MKVRNAILTGSVLAIGLALLVLLGLSPGSDNSASALAAPPSQESPMAPTGELQGTVVERGPADWAATPETAPAMSAEPAPFRPQDGPEAYQAAKAAADARAAEARAAGETKAEAPLAPPTLKAKNYEGVNQNQSGGWRPPDTHGAVGKTQFVEIVNSQLQVYRKSDGLLQKNVSLANFFGYFTTSLFDPRVVYDHHWNRFIATADSFPDGAGFQRHFIAVSKTGSATGGWWIYAYGDMSFGGAGFWDYPDVGYDQDAVIITANWFDNVTGACQSLAMAMPKAKWYNGIAVGLPFWGGLPCTLKPPIVLDGNANAYFVAANNLTHLHLYRGNNLSNLGYQTLVLQAAVDVPDYGVPPNAPQPGTADLLDTLDRRFVNVSTQYGDSLWNVHTIDMLGWPTPKFYELDTEGAAANTVKQQGFFFEGGTSYDWNATIAANPSGEAFVTWNSTDVSGAPHQARIRFSGRQPADPLGVIPAGTALFTSATFYNPSGDLVERWGDYSAVSLDPSPQGACAAMRRAWIVNEKINAVAVWGSRIARIGFC